MQGVLFTYNINASDEESGTDEVEGNLRFWTNASFFTIDIVTGLINFTPTNDDVGNHTINISVNDTVNQNSTLIVFSIAQYNDPPNITGFSPNSTFNMSENSTQLFNISVNDPDGDSLTYSWLMSGVEQSTDMNWTFNPGFGFAGNYNITIIISDGILSFIAGIADLWSVFAPGGVTKSVASKPDILNYALLSLFGDPASVTVVDRARARCNLRQGVQFSKDFLEQESYAK